MKLYATLFLLAVVVVASPCTVKCRAASGTAPPPTCDPLALHLCAPVTWGEAPSAACCAELREQKRCLCKYLKTNPYLSKYINSPDGMKVAAAYRLRELRC